MQAGAKHTSKTTSAPHQCASCILQLSPRLLYRASRFPSREARLLDLRADSSTLPL